MCQFVGWVQNYGQPAEDDDNDTNDIHMKKSLDDTRMLRHDIFPYSDINSLIIPTTWSSNINVYQIKLRHYHIKYMYTSKNFSCIRQKFRFSMDNDCQCWRCQKCHMSRMLMSLCRQNTFHGYSVLHDNRSWFHTSFSCLVYICSAKNTTT